MDASDSMAARALAAEESLARSMLENAELRRKLKAQHVELMRRARRDAELAHYLPAIAARMQALAADAALGPAPKSWDDHELSEG